MQDELKTQPQHMTTPILAIGTFGTHVTETAGIWSFTGTVPRTIKRGGYPTEKSALSAFVDWFKAQDIDFQRDHIGDLRNDIFTAVMG